MVADVKSALKEFSALLGEEHLTTDAATCSTCAVDGKVPRLIVYPSTAEEVAAVLKLAADSGFALIPFRNRTKLDIGNPPERYDMGLSLKGMNNVWHYEPADLTISVEPGLKLKELQHLVARDRLWLPLDPAGDGQASLGGIVAANASGPLRHAYGSPRDMVLGMKIATVQGKIIKTGGRVVKNVAGYDLGKLLIGSYGTLGVIVEVSLKLFPLPGRRETFILQPGNLGIARDLRRRILESPLSPLRMVLLVASAGTKLRVDAPRAFDSSRLEMCIDAGGSDSMLMRIRTMLEGIAKELAVPFESCNAQDAENTWVHASDFRRWIGEGHPQAIVLKICLPISASEQFLSMAQQEAENAKARMAAMSLLGVGIVYVAVLDSLGAADGEHLTRRLKHSAENLGGVLIVEQCPLELKMRLDVWGEPKDDYEIMRKLKMAWDSRRTLAPGRMIGRI